MLSDLDAEDRDPSDAVAGTSTWHFDHMDEDAPVDFAENTFDGDDEDFDSQDGEEDDGEVEEESDEEWVPPIQGADAEEEEEDAVVRLKARKPAASPAKSTKSTRSNPSKSSLNVAEGVDNGPSDTPNHGAMDIDTKPPRPKPKQVKQAREIHHLTMDDSLDEPAIVPNRKARKEAESSMGEGSTYVPDVGEPGVIKKKKRCVHLPHVQVAFF